MHPTIFFDPSFVANIIAGWFLTAGGVFLLLVARPSGSSVAEEQWLRGTPKPTAWRGLCAIGVAAFIAGLAVADGRLLPNRRPHLSGTRRELAPFRCLPRTAELRRR